MQPILFRGSILNRNKSSNQRMGVSPFLAGMTPTLGILPLKIAGVTKDSTGAPLGNCAVELYLTATDQMLEHVTSDANGNYSFSTVGLAETYYLVAYKTGSPDVTGATVDTLVGS